MKFQYFAQIDDNGKLTLTNSKGFLSDIKALAGKWVVLTVENKSKRSNKQNSYFHGVIIPIVKAHLLDLGWAEARDDEWVKDYIKYHCLIKDVVNEKSGEVEKALGKTSGLSTGEFMDFIADVQRWAAEKLDLYIPDPGEIMELQFQTKTT